jgi:hypothetical protein
MGVASLVGEVRSISSLVPVCDTIDNFGLFPRGSTGERDSRSREESCLQLFVVDCGDVGSRCPLEERRGREREG